MKVNLYVREPKQHVKYHFSSFNIHQDHFPMKLDIKEVINLSEKQRKKYKMIVKTFLTTTVGFLSLTSKSMAQVLTTTTSQNTGMFGLPTDFIEPMLMLIKMALGGRVSTSNIINDSSRSIKNVEKEKGSNRVDYRYYQRIHSDYNSNTSNFLNILRSHSDIWEFRNVSKSIRNFFKKIALPVTVFSSSFLFANFSHASTWDVITQKKGILSQDFSGDDKTTWLGIGEIVKNILNAIDFIKNINQHIYQWSIDLLAWIYSTLTTVVLHTPIFLFNNDFVRNTSLIFSVTSVSITIVLTIFESIMRMLRKNHTEFKQILKRFPVVVAISGFAPFLF